MMKVLKQIEGGVNHFAFFFSLRTGDNSLASLSSNRQADRTGGVRCPARTATSYHGVQPREIFCRIRDNELTLTLKDANIVVPPPTCYNDALLLPGNELAQLLFAAAQHRGRLLPACRLTYTCSVLSPLRALYRTGVLSFHARRATDPSRGSGVLPGKLGGSVWQFGGGDPAAWTGLERGDRPQLGTWRNSARER